MSERNMTRSIGVSDGQVGNSRSHEQQRVTTMFDDDCTSSPAFRSLVSDIMNWGAAPDYKRHELECILRKHLMQESNFASSKGMLFCSAKRSPSNQIDETGSRNLQLKILGEIGQPVFTGIPIKGTTSQPLRVALVDCQSGEVVTFGPEASATIEIVALEGDFGGCLGDNWTREDFKNKIVTKDGKRQLLTGNVVLKLEKGIGCVGNVRFSHTKNWKNKHAYRVGVIATCDDLGAKIKEGFTKSFDVRDRRLESNVKHHPPIQSDEVYRLEGIGKDGAYHQRLNDIKVYTVEDLLKRLNTDPQKIRDILGKNMSAKMWEALVDHARTCIIDDTLYLYSSSDSVQKNSVVFDVVGQVVGLILESQYIGFQMLSESQKAHSVILVMSAFQQWDKVVFFDDESSFDNYIRSNHIIDHQRSPTVESSREINISIPPETDESNLVESAISFEDKASLFEESPGMTSDNWMVISPKIFKLDFSNPNISLDDLDSFINELPNQSATILPPKSPVRESSNVSLFSIPNELDLPQLASSFDDDNILFSESPGPSDTIYSQKSPIMEFNQLDLPQPVVPCQEIMGSSNSVWDMNYYNDYSSQCVAHTSPSHERHLSFSSQVTESDNWEIDSMIQSFWEENQDNSLQFSVDDVPQGSTLELPKYPQNDTSGSLVIHPRLALGHSARKRYLHNKAKRNWRILFSVIRWLFVPKKAAGSMQIKLSSSYQDLQALGIVNDEMGSSQIFDSQVPALFKNLSMKSEENLHSAVNNLLLARNIAVAKNISQRKYLPKNEKARKRWTKLYSVMKWFLLQRKVTKRASSTLSLRGPSRSSSLDDMSSLVATSSWDTCPHEKSSCPFHEEEYLQLFNTICSLQPRDRIAMNKLARRRNVTDSNFAKKKWRMLFSVMKWLSVRKKRPFSNC